MKAQSWFALVVCCTLWIPSLSAEQPTDVYGAWDLTLQTRNGLRPSWVKLFKENDVAVAEFVGIAGGKNRAKAVSVQGNTFHWTMGQVTYRASLVDGRLVGSLTRGDRITQFTGVLVKNSIATEITNVLLSNRFP